MSHASRVKVGTRIIRRALCAFNPAVRLDILRGEYLKDTLEEYARFMAAQGGNLPILSQPPCVAAIQEESGNG